MIFDMTLSVELDLDDVKMNQNAKCLGKKSVRSKIVQSFSK